MGKYKKVLAVLVVAVVTLCSIAAFLPGTKLITRIAPTATTSNQQELEIGFFDLSIFDNSVIHTLTRVVAIDLNTGKAKAFTRQAAFKITGGVLTRLGGHTPGEFEVGDPQTGSWEITVNCDDVTDRVFVRVRGSANTTIEWRAVISIHLYQP